MKLHNVTELVCTRISHDLAGSIGSLSNVLEMLADDPSECEDAIPLLQDNAKTLLNRLKFFRVAFGLKNAQPKDMSDLKSVVEKYLSTFGDSQTPIQISFNLQTVSLYKIIMLCVMVLADTFIKGGKIDVTEHESGLIFKLTSNFNLPEKKLQSICSFIKGEESAENPALGAPIYYLQSLLENTDVQINLTFKEKEAELRIS